MGIFTRKADYFLIVGLGNPGREYENTRHNAGFAAADFIAGEYGVRFKKRFDSECADIVIEGRRGFLQKPLTFMNSSGLAVRRIAQYYRIPTRSIIVMHDDITLNPGLFKIKSGGSDGGHNGLASIINELHSWDFTHVKIGVGAKENKEQPLYDYVLQDFPPADKKAVYGRLGDIRDAVKLLVCGQTEQAKAAYNKSRSD